MTTLHAVDYSGSTEPTLAEQVLNQIADQSGPTDVALTFDHRIIAVAPARQARSLINGPQGGSGCLQEILDRAVMLGAKTVTLYTDCQFEIRNLRYHGLTVNCVLVSPSSEAVYARKAAKDAGWPVIAEVSN